MTDASRLVVAALAVAVGTVAVIGDFLIINDEIARHQPADLTSNTHPVVAQEGK